MAKPYADRNILLFTARYKDKDYDVRYWTGYGIVCPYLVTTNGVPKLAAQSIYHLMTHGAEIEPELIDPRNVESEEELTTLLKDTMMILLHEDGY